MNIHLSLSQFGLHKDKIALFAIICAYLSSCASLHISHAQNVGNTVPSVKSAVVEEMDVHAFEKWSATERSRVLATNDEPTALHSAIMQRLRTDRNVTTVSLIGDISAWVHYERRLEVGGKVVEPGQVLKYSFPKSKHVITEILPLLYGRPEDLARLLFERASLLRLESDYAGARQAYDEGAKIIEPVRYEIDYVRFRNTVSAASALLQEGMNREADELYFDVLGYPFYRVDDPEWSRTFGALYVEAGRGLLAARRGNITLLKQIQFAPAFRDELGPALKASITAAENARQNEGPANGGK